ncbi:hypothetical protein AVEN_242365-1 [Araneus ventricosus]|uniref:Uncharacterized protein n=1 Tax=Araneus ventricosus TaxID=182803 RepID=A0A4Y2MQK4_ARAVE|nr:hypothetical protein AVEN_242365-1 [Araneus ventricosus]
MISGCPHFSSPEIPEHTPRADICPTYLPFTTTGGTELKNARQVAWTVEQEIRNQTRSRGKPPELISQGYYLEAFE